MNPRNVLVTRLEEIKNRRGGVLEAGHVVEDARPAESLLHRYFEWDDGAAAEAYRIDQARRLIRSVRVVVHTEDRIISHVKYIRNPSLTSEPGYVETVSLRSDEDRAREAVRAELKQALVLLRRACDIAAVLGLEEDFRDVLKRSEAVLLKVAA